MGAGGEARSHVGVVGGGVGVVGEVEEVEEQHVSGNENLQNSFQSDRKQDALPVIRGEKKPCVSCRRYSHQKSMGYERPGIALYYGLADLLGDVHLNSFLP